MDLDYSSFGYVVFTDALALLDNMPYYPERNRELEMDDSSIFNTNSVRLAGLLLICPGSTNFYIACL